MTPPNGVRFKKDRQGITFVVQKYYEERVDIKKEMLKLNKSMSLHQPSPCQIEYHI